MALALGIAPAAAHAEEPDWSLERTDDDPTLIEQRLTKLQRHPLDQTEWRALERALGRAAFFERLRRLHAKDTTDPGNALLMVRVQRASGDAHAALHTLTTFSGRWGRWSDAVLDQHVEILLELQRPDLAVDELEEAAQRGKPSARMSRLQRAYEIAAQSLDPPRSLSLAQRLAELEPRDAATQLRLARAAQAAGKHDLASTAYERSIAGSPVRRQSEIMVEWARAELASGRADHAAARLWRLLTEQPKREPASIREPWWELWADAHRNASSISSAVEMLRDHLERQRGDEVGAWWSLARLQQSLGQDPIAALQRAIEIDPRDSNLRFFLVETYEARGRFDEALEQTVILVRKDIEECARALEVASRLIGNGQRAAAMKLAGVVADRVEHDGDKLLVLLDFYNLNDEPESALAVARRLVVLRPRDPETRVALGEQLFQMHRVNDALHEWNQLPKLIRPRHAALARHAEVMLEHGRTSDALDSLGKALELAPGQIKYMRLRAIVAEQQRRWPLALSLWDRIRNEASSPADRTLREEARTRMIELLVGGGLSQDSRTIEQLEQSARTLLDQGRPRDAAVEAGMLLAELYTRQERYREAVGVHQRLSNLDPDDPELVAQLAAAQRRAGDIESAQATLEHLVALDPSRETEILAELSELAFASGNNEAALARARRSATQGPRRVEALLRLGELHERSGDLLRAQEAYDEALTIAPSDGRARLRLAELALTRGKLDRAATLLQQILEQGGPPDLLRDAGRRALDLAEVTQDTMAVIDLALARARRAPNDDEPREFLLAALERAGDAQLRQWLRGPDSARATDRISALREQLVLTLSRGPVGARMRAADHLGRLDLPDTAVPLAKMGAQLEAPRDATRTIAAVFEQARIRAITGAGELDDARAVPVFAAILGDPQQTAAAARAAAWSLARSSSSEAMERLVHHLRVGADPQVSALTCLSIAKHATQAKPEWIREAAVLARDSRELSVRHACSLAEATARPVTQLRYVLADLQVDDATRSAIAAWRLGSFVGLRGHQREEVMAQLFRKFLGARGLARDAAAAALANLMGQPSTAPLDPLPPPVIGAGWDPALERWLRARVAPSFAALPRARIHEYQGPLLSAITAVRAGTRADRHALTQALSTVPATQHARFGGCKMTRDETERQLCLAPLFDVSVPVPAGALD